MNLRALLIFLVLFLSIRISVGQLLPPERYYSADGRILYGGGSPDPGWYELDSIRQVNLQFPQTNYWSLLQANYTSETLIPATLTVGNLTLDSVGVRFRGNTSYTTITNSQKKSFAIETDFVRSGQKLMGYRNLKFNNAHTDASFMREVLYNQLAMRHIPIAKASYIRLSLNGQDWGLYPNIQAVDKTFLDEWFLSNDGPLIRATRQTAGVPGGQWGDGTAGMNFLGVDTNLYKNYYYLKSSDLAQPWTYLMRACSVLAQTSVTSIDTAQAYLDIDKILWFLATENIFTDDDSYVYKGKMDYIVYYEPETGLTTPLEYDGNSTFITNNATSSSWGPFKNVTNANYPLLNKLLNIPQWRQRYLAHYRTLLQEVFNPSITNPLIDRLNTLIAAQVASDPKKLYTTSQYTSGVPALKTFVQNRRNYMLANAEVALVAPLVDSAHHLNSQLQLLTAPIPGEVSWVRAFMAQGGTPIQEVRLHYSDRVVGRFTSVPMFDDGQHQDLAAGDGIYGAQLPAFTPFSLVRYYIEAIGANSAQSRSYLPTGAEHDVFVFRIQGQPLGGGVVINEFVASNQSGAQDESGGFADWVELHNTSAQAISLSGWYLSDDQSNPQRWRIPSGISIPAGGYLIIWTDADSLDGPLHTNFRLSAAGEDVVLSNSSGQLVDLVNFPLQITDTAYARIPNGTGPFTYRSPTFAANNQGNPNAVHTLAPLQLLLYPNPARDWLRVVLLADGSSSTTLNPSTSGLVSPPSVRVLDLQGRVLPTEVRISGETEWMVDLQTIPAGLYILEAKYGGRIQFARFVCVH
ncbi:MAG: hypothetical protein FJ344_03580 [Sphingomonadales bacterium]|nr:hypothetical protein [Sphingomonadales bacterium]